MPLCHTPQVSSGTEPIGRTPKSVSFVDPQRCLDYSDLNIEENDCYERDPNATPYVPLECRKKRLTDEGRAELGMACKEIMNQIIEELDASKNLKNTIKGSIKAKLRTMYDNICDLTEFVETQNLTPGYHPSVRTQTSPEAQSTPLATPSNLREIEATVRMMAGLLEKNSKCIQEIQNVLNQKSEHKPSYSEVTAGGTGKTGHSHATLHSVAVSSTGLETGEEILEQVREAVGENNDWIRVERVRKAKERKVIVSCISKEERRKLKERIEQRKELRVEEIQNKDPLLILKNIIKNMTSEELIDKIRKQNGELLDNIRHEENRIEVRFKKPARNQLLNHVVVRVAPAIWNKMVTAGSVHVDMQRIYAEDYSPLIQCSMCLGYGHVRKYCGKKTEKCSHCGGDHRKTECSGWLAGALPSCLNCNTEDNEVRHHNAFSSACQVRQRWDALARSRVAYS